MSTAQTVDPSSGKKPLSTRAKRGIWVGSILLVAGALVATYLIITAGPAQSKQFATFHLQEGSVEIQRAGQGAFGDAAEGQTLREGDVIRTGADGRAEIEYFDGSITRLDYNTTFTIVALEDDAETDATVIEADQTSGGTFSRVVELSGSDSRFETGTPTAVASVRGTDYFVLLNPDQTQTFGVIEGRVQVTGTVGEGIDLSALRGVGVSPSGVLGAPFDLPPELFNSDFLRWNLCERDFVTSVCTEVDSEVQEKKKEKKEEEEEPPPPPAPQAPEIQPAAVTYPPPSVAPTVLPAGQPGGPGGGTGVGPLAFTGARLTVWVAVALALALSGIALYALGRRRGTRTVHE
jgi:hypothetical protein